LKTESGGVETHSFFSDEREAVLVEVVLLKWRGEGGRIYEWISGFLSEDFIPKNLVRDAWVSL